MLKEMFFFKFYNVIIANNRNQLPHHTHVKLSPFYQLPTLDITHVRKIPGTPRSSCNPKQCRPGNEASILVYSCPEISLVSSLTLFPTQIPIDWKKSTRFVLQTIHTITISERRKQFDLHMKFVIPFLGYTTYKCLPDDALPRLLLINTLATTLMESASPAFSSQTSELVHFDLSSHGSIARL